MYPSCYLYPTLYELSYPQGAGFGSSETLWENVYSKLLKRLLLFPVIYLEAFSIFSAVFFDTGRT